MNEETKNGKWYGSGDTTVIDYIDTHIEDYAINVTPSVWAFDEQKTKQKEVLYLLNGYLELNNKRMAKLGIHNCPCPVLSRIKKLLTEMWGE